MGDKIIILIITQSSIPGHGGLFRETDFCQQQLEIRERDKNIHNQLWSLSMIFYPVSLKIRHETDQRHADGGRC